MVNRVEVSGRLTRAPEVRYLGDARFPIATMNVAVDDGSGRFNRETRKTEYGSGFYKVEAAGQYGEWLSEVLEKGDEVHVVGSLSQFTRQGRDGGESSTHTSIRAVSVIPLKRMSASVGIAPPDRPLVDAGDGWGPPPDQGVDF